MAAPGLETRLREVRETMPGRPSARAFARMCGIEPSTYHKYEKYGVEPSATNILKIGNCTGADVVWLVTGIGGAYPDGERAVWNPPPSALEETRSTYLPVLATASAADLKGRVAYVEHSELGDIDLPPDLHAVRVAGDSMCPVVLEGQFVLCRMAEPEEGDLAVVDLAGDDEALFKRVHYEGKTRIVLTSVNPDPRFQTPLVLHRAAIRVMRKIWGVKF